jgi:pyruvate/2-oxoglutarate dehydrogenase complex dihydrolipoamide acyltransferase (E2) component
MSPAAHAAGLFYLWGLRGEPNGFKFGAMDGAQQAAIHQALVSVQHAVTSMTFPSCDQEDLIEAIDRVEEQLHNSHPNLALMCRFLNSIARSLRAQPEARDACLAIEDAIGKAGMPSTWQSGI